MKKLKMKSLLLESKKQLSWFSRSLTLPQFFDELYRTEIFPDGSQNFLEQQYFCDELLNMLETEVNTFNSINKKIFKDEMISLRIIILVFAVIEQIESNATIAPTSDVDFIRSFASYIKCTKKYIQRSCNGYIWEGMINYINNLETLDIERHHIGLFPKQYEWSTLLQKAQDELSESFLKCGLDTHDAKFASRLMLLGNDLDDEKVRCLSTSMMQYLGLEKHFNNNTLDYLEFIVLALYADAKNRLRKVRLNTELRQVSGIENR